MVVANETGANFGGNLFVDSLSDDSGPASSYIKMLEHNLDLIKKGLFELWNQSIIKTLGLMQRIFV